MRRGPAPTATAIESQACADIVALVRQAVPLLVAARSCGIHRSTFQLWVKRGKGALADAMELEAGGGRPALEASSGGAARPTTLGSLAGLFRVLRAVARPDVDFDFWCMGLARAVDEADAGAEKALALKVRLGANDNPELALKLLERRFPARWGKAKEAAVSVTTGQVGALTIYAPPEEDPDAG